MKRHLKSAGADHSVGIPKRKKKQSNLTSTSPSARVQARRKSHSPSMLASGSSTNKKQTDFSTLSVDDFMNFDFGADSDSEDESLVASPKCKVNGNAGSDEESKDEVSDEADSDSDDGNQVNGNAGSDEESMDEADSDGNDGNQVNGNAGSDEESMDEVSDEADSDSDDGKLTSVSKRKVNGFIDDEAEEGEESMDEEVSGDDDDEADDEDEDEPQNGGDFLDDEAKEDKNVWLEKDGSVDDDHSAVDDDNKDYAELSADEDDVGNDANDMSAAGHKKSLKKLQETDREFFDFLEKNDKKLLQFDVSDSDSEQEDMLHKPDDNLEVASEDSDYEDETDVKVEDGVITLKMVREWQELIQTDKSMATIADVVSAFQAAMIRVTSVDEPCKFKVDGSAVFNGVVQLCVMQLQPAFKRFLRLPPGSEGKHIQLKKCKKWKKIKPQLKSYILNLLKLLGGVSSTPIVSVLLKHLHQLTQFVACFGPIARKAAKYLVTVWGTAEDSTRVIAFLCILRLTNTDRTMLDAVLKQMYLSYVSNAKFTSPSTRAGINFMRRSLVELYSLDESISYQHVFLYIRQLAIHLRNAITLQKKEAMQAVLNWQFVHSIHLWSDLLSENKPSLQPLLYPLVQIMIGTVKLIPTAQYFPLRFHLSEMMADLSRRTNTFIPVLPLLLEVLSSYDLNRRGKKASMKPMNMTCVLRASKTEQSEVNFKDAVVEQVYQRMMQYLAQEAHSIGFPDLAVPALMQLRKFLKTCKVSNYCKLIKSLVDKTEENSRWIEKARKASTLVLSDRKAVEAWETNSRLRGPPLVAFYASFQAVNERKMAKRITDNDKLGDEYKIPMLKKHVKKEPLDDGKVVLFPSDDDDDSEIEPSTSREVPAPAKKKKKKKKKKKVTKVNPILAHQSEDGTEEDIVQDLKMEDF